MSTFTQIQNTRPSSNTFDLSHDKKMSLKMGELVPIHVMDLVPGDKIKMATSQMLRLAPMLAPIMHQINVYTHFYFVPNRILWPNWPDFITGGEDGLDDSVFPTILSSGAENGSLEDYIGMPYIGPAAGDRAISAVPFSAYQLIYNEYYRDQNLIDKVDYKLVDGGNTTNLTDLTTLRTRAWQHDYFTSALPWTQKGVQATIPLGTTAPLVDDFTQQTIIQQLDGTAPSETGGALHAGTGGRTYLNLPTLADENVNIDITGHTTVDLSTATSATINDLRQAYKLQEWLEKNARGGSRYIESIKSHFGVTSPDARLQRPEYLGGGSSPVSISEVLQTSSNDAEPTPQGNMAGHGIAVGANNSFQYRATEHGYIIGIMSILPKTAYFQGIPKHLRKFDKFDYYWPSFAHLGEQPILNYELLANDDGTNYDTFGYTPRYAEYKHMLSTVHGEFRSTLDFWHMARKFANRPALNQEFIEADPTTRIFAVLDSETVYAHVFHRIKAKRLMPYFGTPQ